MRKFILSLFFCLSAFAQTTNPILNNLSSDDWKTRQSAINKLIAKGPDAKPQIEEILKTTTDPTIQSDLQAALKQIDRNIRFGPTLVTLDLKDATPQDAFTQLGKIANTQISGYYDGFWQQRKNPITASYDKQPFWTVFLDLCKRADVSITPGNYNRPGITLQMGNNNMINGPMASSGGFCVVATNITSTRTVTLGNQGHSNSLNMQLSIFVEPKLRVMRMLQPVVVEQATDDLGNTLTSAESRRYNGGWSSGSSGFWYMNAGLRLPDKMGKKLTNISGYVRAIVAQDTSDFTIPQDTKNFTRDLGEVTFTLDKFEVTDNMASIHIACKGPNDSPIYEALTEGPQSGALRLVDSTGEGLIYNGGGSNRSNNSCDVNVNFQMHNYQNKPVTKPLKLMASIPLGSKEMKIPFAFKDLDLP